MLFQNLTITLMVLLSALTFGMQAWAKAPLPLPRYASIRSSTVNLRTGPGTQYPITWTIKHARLPVQIIAEYETWRQIKDPDGTTGWVHQSMLSGKRYVLVRKDILPFLDGPDRQGRILAKIRSGEIATYKRCENGFCQVEIAKKKGWLPVQAVWGLDKKDITLTAE